MHALFKHTLALSMCAACSSTSAEDESSRAPLVSDDAQLSAQAGAPAEAAPPPPLTEEELLRLLEALEHEVGRQK